MAGYEFVTSFGYFLSINNGGVGGGDFVQFWNPLPPIFTTKDLSRSADDVTFNFKDPTGAIVQSSDSIDGIDFDLFPDKSFQWFAVGVKEGGESFSFLLNGDINKMELHVPDGGFTLLLLGIGLVACGLDAGSSRQSKACLRRVGSARG